MDRPAGQHPQKVVDAVAGQLRNGDARGGVGLQEGGDLADGVAGQEYRQHADQAVVTVGVDALLDELPFGADPAVDLCGEVAVAEGAVGGRGDDQDVVAALDFLAIQSTQSWRTCVSYSSIHASTPFSRSNSQSRRTSRQWAELSRA